MIKDLEKALARLRDLPPERQAAAADWINQFLDWNPDDYQLTPEQIADVDAAIKEANAGRFATAEDWQRLRDKMQSHRKTKS